MLHPTKNRLLEKATGKSAPPNGRYWNLFSARFQLDLIVIGYGAVFLG
jgi:hypothetical protein